MGLLKMWDGDAWVDLIPTVWGFDEEAEEFAWLSINPRQYADGIWFGEGTTEGTFRSVWVGGVTDTEARFGVEAPSTGFCRVNVIDPTDAVTTTPSSGVDIFGHAVLEMGDLSPGTDYRYQVQSSSDDGVDIAFTDLGPERTFRTRYSKGDIVDQRFIVSGCHSFDNSSRPWDDAEDYDAEFHIQIGDQNYSDIDSPDPNDHLQWWVQFANVPPMERYYGNVATEQICSDHDGGGPGNGIDKPAILANWTSWQLRVPHLPYPAGIPDGARYRTFDSGRVCFILLDTRSYQRKSGSGGVGESDPNAALGSQQMAWLQSVLDRPDYDDEDGIKLFVIVSDFVTHDKQPGGGKLTGKPDSWSNYPASRSQVSTWMSGKRCVAIVGDNHGLFGDEGTHNPLGFVPMIGCAGMNRSSGNERGESDWDYYFPAQGVEEHIEIYGRFTIEDTGDEITMTMIGRDAISGTNKFTVDKTWDVT